MRAELNNFEHIDKYLSGEMSASESAAFESQMNGDPALKSLVEDQQLFIQTVSRKALMAEINVVAGSAVAAGGAAAAGSTFFGNTFWIASAVIVVGGGTIGAIVATSGDKNEDQIAQNTIETTEASTADTPSEETVNYIDAVSEDQPIEVENGGDGNMTVNIEVNENNGGSQSNTATNNGTTNNTTTSNTTTSNDPQDPVVGPGHLTRVTREVKEKDPDVEEGYGHVDLNIGQKTELGYNGGGSALAAFLKKEVDYPGTAKRKGIEANVEVDFFVDRTGKLDLVDIECVRMNYQEGSKPLTGGQMLMKAGIKRDFEEKARHTLVIMDPWIPETDTYGNPKMSELQTWIFRFDLDHGISFFNPKSVE